MDQQTLRQFCERLEASVRALFPAGLRVEAREDSRAFGAAIEKRVRDHWASICSDNKWVVLDAPGKRDIGDVCCKWKKTTIRVDVKTHDLDSKRYADGGVCSVDNLLRLLAGTNDTGLLVVLEVAHRAKGEHREMDSIDAVPFHGLPIDALRIENLGAGQLRLDDTVRALRERVEWERTVPEFLDPFVVLAKEHYDKVSDVAQERRKHLEAFARGGYRDFKSVR